MSYKDNSAKMKSLQNGPNFFIIGAPKCGTTALSEYLRSNPSIFMSTPKEPHFFADDMKPYACCDNMDDYLGLFCNVKENQKIIGEASVLYMYSENAVKNIYKYNPKARIIIMIRNLVDFIYSYHNQLFINTDENVKNFETAWYLQKDRIKGNSIPKTCRIPKLLKYKEIMKFSSQIENVYRYFPKDQVHIIFMDDFKNNTKNAYKEVLDFLNVEYDNKTDFPVINENRFYRSQKLALLKKSSFMQSVRKIKEKLGLEKVEMMKWFYKLNIVKKKRNPLNKDFRDELLSFAIPEIEKLEKILDKDLSHWKV